MKYKWLDACNGFLRIHQTVQKFAFVWCFLNNPWEIDKAGNTLDRVQEVSFRNYLNRVTLEERRKFYASLETYSTAMC